MDRARVWLAVSPLMAAGILGAHALAYRVTGTPGGALHSYLGHAPQVLLVLAVAGLALGCLASRARRPATWPFPAVAVAAFVLQEHVERLAHTGEVPWLLESRVFLVGLVLQVPVALLTWAFARRLLFALAGPGPRRPRLPRILLDIAASPDLGLRPIPAVAPRGRGPPPYLQTE